MDYGEIALTKFLKDIDKMSINEYNQFYKGLVMDNTKTEYELAAHYVEVGIWLEYLSLTDSQKRIFVVFIQGIVEEDSLNVIIYIIETYLAFLVQQ